MSRSRILVIVAAVVTALLVAAGAYLAWRQIAGLEERIAGLDRQVDDLGGRLAAAEVRAKTAEMRADRAEEDAEEAILRADAADEERRLSAEQAAAAERDRQQALAREREAAAARKAAEERADEAAAARAAAEERRAALERREAELILKVGAAQAQASQVRAEKERLERRMTRELNRMQRALGRIAETQRQALDQATTGLSMTLDSRQIEFDFDKAELRPHVRELLSRIAGVLLTFEDFSMAIVGHTDDVGTVEYNQELSQRRAQGVRDYLVEAGLDPQTLTVRGMGKSSPLVEGTDSEARQRNRRVELLIVFSEGDYGTLVDPQPPEPEPGDPPGP